jgi:AcrR family transcriptional regulator
MQRKRTRTAKESAAAQQRRKRLSPEVRREMILNAAVEYFSDHGFEVQIRQLAQAIGISPALVFRYFETKDELIDCVYNAVFQSRWDDNWKKLVTDPSQALEARLIAFYRSYLATTDDRRWIRIAMRASLDGNDLTRRYLARNVNALLETIALQIRAELGESRIGKPSPDEMERVWQLHSASIYYLVRKHIHGTQVLEDRDAIAEMMVRNFFTDLRRKTPAADRRSKAS